MVVHGSSDSVELYQCARSRGDYRTIEGIQAEGNTYLDKSFHLDLESISEPSGQELKSYWHTFFDHHDIANAGRWRQVREWAGNHKPHKIRLAHSKTDISWWKGPSPRAATSQMASIVLAANLAV
jgi:hypothetical protein